MKTTSSAFTHYWSETTLNPADEGKPFIHTAGNLFLRSGVTTGDRIYGVSIRRGIPTLIGALTLARAPITYEEACDLLPYEPWKAAEHLIGNEASSSTTSYSRTIPLDIVRRLRFVTAAGESPLKFASDTRLDQQTLRGVRRLTAESAAALEALLRTHDHRHPGTTDMPISEDALFPDEISVVDNHSEGSVTRVLVNRYERDPAARMACLAVHGRFCIVCDFNFGESYGDLGAGFIHVHHIIPVSQLGHDYRINPVSEMVPVCPNCHAMLHRTNPPLSIQQLMDIYKASASNGRAKRGMRGRKTDTARQS